MRFAPAYGPGGFQQRSRKADRAAASAFGQIRGVTLLGGAPFPNCTVTFFLRDWTSAGSVISDANGAWTMTGLVAGTEYYFIATDPVGGARYDVDAHVAPAIAAYSGLDAFWSSVVFQYMMDGTNNSTTITDSGRYGANGTCVNQAKLSTASVPFGSAAALFDGVDDSITVTNPSITLGGDCTIDFWCSFTLPGGATQGYMLSGTVAGSPPSIYTGDTGIITALLPGGSSASLPTALGATNALLWNHIAVVTTSTTGRLFLNGVYQASGTSNAGNWITAGTAFALGNNTTNSFRDYNGRIKAMRGTNAIRWPGTTTFQVPNADAYYHAA